MASHYTRVKPNLQILLCGAPPTLSRSYRVLQSSLSSTPDWPSSVPPPGFCMYSSLCPGHSVFSLPFYFYHIDLHLKVTASSQIFLISLLSISHSPHQPGLLTEPSTHITPVPITNSLHSCFLQCCVPSSYQSLVT